MPLSYEQVHKLEQWWDSTGVNRNCPMCGSGQWETGEIVSGADVSNQGNVLPMAQVICGNCRYVMLFAAMPIGLV
jgi:predicted nucleic-acid-binding Zn-ribbon protein